MNLARLPYRVWQVWQALFARPDAEELQIARKILSPTLWDLFTTLQPGEQAHSLNILCELQRLGESDSELLIAALLHDTGKSVRPLRLWERIWIVIHKRFFRSENSFQTTLAPEQVLDLPFWRQPLAVAAFHPAWGARMASERGASDLVVELIAAHQDQMPFAAGTRAARFLTVLQSVDDEN